MSERRRRPGRKAAAASIQNGKERGRRRGAGDNDMHQRDDAADDSRRRRRPQDPPRTDGGAKSGQRWSKKLGKKLGSGASSQPGKSDGSTPSRNRRRRTRNKPNQSPQNGRSGTVSSSSDVDKQQPRVDNSTLGKQLSNNHTSKQVLSVPPRDTASLPPRLQKDLQTRRRKALDIATKTNEDGSVECDVRLDNVDPTVVYKCQFAPEKLFVEKALGDNMSDYEGGDNAKREAEGRGLRLGKNGWHRALDTIGPLSLPPIRSHHSYAASETSTLDQMTATHLLQSVHPQIDEIDAIEEEYEHLLTEIKALERDRVQLEQQFHEAGRLSSQRSLRGKRLTYSTFRTNLRYMKAEDMKSLPLTWLEDAPLSSPGGRKGSNRRRSYAKLDEQFQDRVRDHRGVGVALLIADAQCKASLIGRCFRNSRYGFDNPGSSPTVLKREKAATLMEEGGEFLKHFAITGLANATNGGGVDSLGTAYFVKFDSGKTHHRGDLPSNLAARLFREQRDKGSLTYLSTGCSYAAGGGHRSYYAEFESGECWWGTNKDDVLDKVFMEMDVHRVAFGGSSGTSVDSSWVVLGKDGSVRWKNVPQGLHDVLVAQEAEGSSVPCEVSLGIGGTYFIRFLDGRVDFCLPNFVADVFEKFEADGKLIRDVALHVDTYDCLIRYSVAS